MKKVFAVLSILVLCLSVSSAALAEEKTGPSAEEMVFDVVIVRPLSIVSTAAGAALFVVGLPFTIPSGTIGVAAKKLIADPFIFTFGRPVGEFRGYYYTSPKK